MRSACLLFVQSRAGGGRGQLARLLHQQPGPSDPHAHLTRRRCLRAAHFRTCLFVDHCRCSAGWRCGWTLCPSRWSSACRSCSFPCGGIWLPSLLCAHDALRELIPARCRSMPDSTSIVTAATGGLALIYSLQFTGASPSLLSFARVSALTFRG